MEDKKLQCEKFFYQTVVVFLGPKHFNFSVFLILTMLFLLVSLLLGKSFSPTIAYGDSVLATAYLCIILIFMIFITR